MNYQDAQEGIAEIVIETRVYVGRGLSRRLTTVCKDQIFPKVFNRAVYSETHRQTERAMTNAGFRRVKGGEG